jgi:hypothetical protein
MANIAEPALGLGAWLLLRLRQSGEYVLGKVDGRPARSHLFLQFKFAEDNSISVPKHLGGPGELEKEVLNFKPTPPLQQVGNKRSKQVEDRKHRIG